VFHYAVKSESGNSENIVKYLLSINNKMGTSKLDLIQLRTSDNSTLLHWAVLFDSKVLLINLLESANQDFISEKGGRFNLTAVDLANELHHENKLLELTNNKFKCYTLAKKE
jgi:hypothetical protein